MTAKMAAAQEYYVRVPLSGGHLRCHFFGISPCTYVLLKKAIFWWFYYEKSQIICKFDHFRRNFRDNSVKNYCSDISKTLKTAAWWALHLWRQNFFLNKCKTYQAASFRVIGMSLKLFSAELSRKRRLKGSNLHIICDFS